MHVHTGALRDQERETGALELELQEVGTHQAWVEGAENLIQAARSASARHLRRVSSPSSSLFQQYMFLYLTPQPRFPFRGFLSGLPLRSAFIGRFQETMYSPIQLGSSGLVLDVFIIPQFSPRTKSSHAYLAQFNCGTVSFHGDFVCVSRAGTFSLLLLCDPGAQSCVGKPQTIAKYFYLTNCCQPDIP